MFPVGALGRAGWYIRKGLVHVYVTDGNCAPKECTLLYHLSPSTEAPSHCCTVTQALSYIASWAQYGAWVQWRLENQLQQGTTSSLENELNPPLGSQCENA
ncbi:hypothetical protein DUNSADRAFT_6835 [Dunaliella salina]|uniref:Uncharacterized protein n=1 Tax=Dunaliella salina TaxID=3046 RepID=A0ABQ7GMQ1_DUNSA|nr:hypothetical protein DUNSADRAFT_6835 [Dunaliella salina]|eukprot:KAF5835848.1 hypothetical protein DUNSADRAFT_6835 [Dunaliella salina]